MIKNIFLSNFKYIFIGLVVLDVLIGNSAFSQYRVITKPLILFSLLIYFAFLGKHLATRTYALMITALVCSFLGDVFLLFDTYAPIYFMLGLGSFLLAHLSYGVVFIKRWNKKPPLYVHAIAVCLIAYGAALFFYLKPDLSALTYPVMLYIIGILFMAISALRRLSRVPKISFLFVFIGALFFVISDSILAIGMFKHEVPWSNVLIIGTYTAAQFFIVKGVLHQTGN